MIFWTLASSSKSYCRILKKKLDDARSEIVLWFFLDSDFHAVVSCYCNGLGYCFPKSKLKSSHFPKSIRQKFRGQGMRMTDQTRVFRILFMTFMYTFQRERDRRLSVNFHFQVSTRIFSFCESNYLVFVKKIFSNIIFNDIFSEKSVIHY